MVYEIGKKSEIFGADLLQPLRLSYGETRDGRPVAMPRVPEGHKLICGLDVRIYEKLYVCETVEDMQQLYDHYAEGMTLSINWYSGSDPGFVTVVGPKASAKADNKE